MILIGMVKHSQSSHNSKFAMSLQYLKKKLEMKLIFLHADKQSFLKVDFNSFNIKVSYKLILSFMQGDEHDQAFLKYSK